MKNLFFLFALMISTGGYKTFAQTGTTSAANLDAISKADRIVGSFQFPISSTETGLATFAVSPKNPSASLEFYLRTADPMPFKATVTDAAGKVVYTWTPTVTLYEYMYNWDVSKFPSGTYNINFYYDSMPNIAHTVAFTKL